MVAHNPLHGSGRAGLPHPALASGNDAEAAQGIVMIDSGFGQVSIDQAGHALPRQPSFLTSPRQTATPQPRQPVAEQPQRLGVHGHPVVAVMSREHRGQPVADFRHRPAHAATQLGLDFGQLPLQSPAHALPIHREVAVAALSAADVREAEKIKGLRFALAFAAAVFRRPRTKLDQPRLLRV